MDGKKISMIVGAAIIVLFIGWFYIGQLSVTEKVVEEDTIAEQVESGASNNKEEDEGIEPSFQRTDSQGTLAIQATLIPEKSSSKQLFFEIVFNTHSGDLLQYKIEQLAKLSFQSSENPSGTFEWDLANEDSHHMVGYLSWSGEVLDENITLKLDNIENVSSREFIWEKNDIALITQTDQ
ncbi:hypothetical protein [Robertmurraya massiliosenegalensis]|uniref:hypothetical protein n=1 Tax=Robertmurraya massiliosenegalensis TaxID=1287657 RepID=UPI0003136DFB|nr:hypothetical protein [Robertmurraya massiliosenegalensis]